MTHQAGQEGDLLGRWERQWQAGSGADAPHWPAGAAEAVVAALVASLDDPAAATADLADAGRRWAGTQMPVGFLIGQLGQLRDLLGERHSARAGAIQQAVDHLTTATTEAVLAVAHDAARTDPLTGVGNRRAMVEAVRPAVAAAVRSGNGLAVVSIDVVGLKALNDSIGHAAGDRALADLAGAVQGALRQSDQLFRVGGDEFVAVLPLVGAADVADIMERAGADGAPPFSWGMAHVPEDGTTIEAALASADQRLYQARRHRRGRRKAKPADRMAGTAGTVVIGPGRRR